MERVTSECRDAFLRFVLMFKCDPQRNVHHSDALVQPLWRHCANKCAAVLAMSIRDKC